jgi:hypothetical protein
VDGRRLGHRNGFEKDEPACMLIIRKLLAFTDNFQTNMGTQKVLYSRNVKPIFVMNCQPSIIDGLRWTNILFVHNGYLSSLFSFPEWQEVELVVILNKLVNYKLHATTTGVRSGAVYLFSKHHLYSLCLSAIWTVFFVKKAIISSNVCSRLWIPKRGIVIWKYQLADVLVSGLTWY